MNEIRYGDTVRIKESGVVGKVKHADVDERGNWYGVESKGERYTVRENELEKVEKKTGKVVDKWFN